jgi:hypothetical protein
MNTAGSATYAVSIETWDKWRILITAPSAEQAEQLAEQL